MRRLPRPLLLGSIILAAAAIVAAQAPVPRVALTPRDGPALATAASWAYQLQRVEPASIDPAFDVLVTDYSRDGTADGAWTGGEVGALRGRPGARPRIVLAYLSIGEAEAYRAYWRTHWRLAPPAWLGQENTEWPGNYAVRFWHPDWQRIHLDPSPSLLRSLASRWLPSLIPEPYLDRILEAGFDGVYLDKVDAFEDWADERPVAADDMARFVAAIADYARARRPGFLIVPQNGEELLANPEYLKKIDGIAKEDLTHGIAGDGTPNAADDVAAATADLDLAAAAGLPVFQVEYLDDPAARREVQLEAVRRGYRLLFARRELNLPTEPLPRLDPNRAN